MRDRLRLVGVQKREGRYDLVEKGFGQGGKLRCCPGDRSSYTGRLLALGWGIGGAVGIFEKVVQCQGDERHGNLVYLLLMRVGRFEQLDDLSERGFLAIYLGVNEGSSRLGGLAEPICGSQI
jgi:hypothetical protein